MGREQRGIIKHLRCSCLVKFNFVFCIPCWVFRCSQCLKDGRARGWIKVNHILWFFLGLDSCLMHIKWRTRPRHINYSGKHPEGYKKLVESSCKGWRNLGRYWELSSNSNKVMDWIKISSEVWMFLFGNYHLQLQLFNMDLASSHILEKSVKETQQKSQQNSNLVCKNRKLIRKKVLHAPKCVWDCQGIPHSCGAP